MGLFSTTDVIDVSFLLPSDLAHSRLSYTPHGYELLHRGYVRLPLSFRLGWLYHLARSLDRDTPAPLGRVRMKPVRVYIYAEPAIVDALRVRFGLPDDMALVGQSSAGMLVVWTIRVDEGDLVTSLEQLPNTYTINQDVLKSAGIRKPPSRKVKQTKLKL